MSVNKTLLIRNLQEKIEKLSTNLKKANKVKADLIKKKLLPAASRMKGTIDEIKSDLEDAQDRLDNLLNETD